MAFRINLCLMNLSLSFVSSSPLTLPQGTVLPGSLLTHPSNASPSPACAQSTDLPPLYRTSKPPSTAGAMGSDAPHRMAISAPETEDLHHESPHDAAALAAPHRDDLPDGPELSQDDRLLLRRTTLNTSASDAAADHEAALNATASLMHSSTISDVPAIYAPGHGCCQQPPSPTGIMTGGPESCAQSITP